MFSKKKKSEVEELTLTPEIDEVESEPVVESVLDTEVEVEKASKSERVSGGKQTLGFMGFLLLIVCAVTAIINFSLWAKDGFSYPENSLQLVPIIFNFIVALMSYIVFACVGAQFIKNKKKGVKVVYGVSMSIAYVLVIVQFIIQVVYFAQKVSGNN